MPILLTLRYTLQPLRGEAAAPQYEGKWDHQAIADCLQKRDMRVEFLKAVDSSFEEAKPKFEALREDPTTDARWALWIDCMREPARTFFSLHRTSKKDDAKRRLSALRRKLVSEQATRREQMGKFLGDIWAPGRLLRTTPARAAQALDFELATAPMDETIRSSSKNVVGNGVAQIAEREPKP